MTSPSSAAALALPAALAAEIAALPPDASYGTTQTAVNNLRAKYNRSLASYAVAADMSDTLRINIGADIGLQCDRAMALRAPIQDARTRWTSVPIDTLTPAEKAAR